MFTWLNNLYFKWHIHWLIGHKESSEIRVLKKGKHKNRHFRYCTKCKKIYFID